MTVVAHNEYGLLDVAEVVLQPFYGLQVEVVGRLVEKQVVWMSEKSLCQHDPNFLVVRQLAHVLAVQLVLYTKVLHQLCGLAFCFPAVHLGKLQLQFGSPVAVFLRHFRLCVQHLTLLHVLPQWSVSHEYGIHYAELVIFEVVLLQYGESLARTKLNRTLVWLKVAAYGTQES